MTEENAVSRENKSLPYELQNSDTWKTERNKILSSLEKDAKGLPMTTAQDMLMERMSTFYVLMRKREAEAEVPISFQDMRANQQQWLAMTAEFNKQITIGEDKRRAAMINTILEIIKNAIAMVEDERIRDDLRKRLEEGFQSAGL